MYIVEGNIGVGKSTFLRLVSELDDQIDTVPEPLENWTNKDYGQSLLSEFYKDTPRWAYTIETLAMMSRVRDHLRETQSPNHMRLMERSIYSGHYCFAKNDYANKHLSNVEWLIYSEWVDFLVKGCRPPLGFIYLKARPEVCYERVIKRHRESEINLSLEYMKQIDRWHERFLIQREDLFESIKDTPVLVLDCNEDFVDNRDRLLEHIEAVRGFIGVNITSESDEKVEKYAINSLTS